MPAGLYPAVYPALQELCPAEYRVLQGLYPAGYQVLPVLYPAECPAVPVLYLKVLYPESDLDLRQALDFQAPYYPCSYILFPLKNQVILLYHLHIIRHFDGRNRRLRFSIRRLLFRIYQGLRPLQLFLMPYIRRCLLLFP